MRERHNVPPKTQTNTLTPVDGQERTANWVTLLVLQCTGPGIVGAHV